MNYVKERQKEIANEIREVTSALDDEAFAITALCVMALERGDMRLVQALSEVAEPQPKSATCEPSEIDIGLVQRIRGICANSETMFWGTALNAAVERNDKPRLERLYKCIRIRTAN
ncbi:hypothetical protein [Planktotalea arctica]|uniref:hypothetical protein n=1 Tax=Planktotalea arctica TaxID=1481893 RepID=UPI000A1774D4|nr:hypothetical protein [Planktotalea arctica]